MKSATLPSLVSFFGESAGDVIKPQPAAAARLGRFESAIYLAAC
jgi:hypothetical protein